MLSIWYDSKEKAVAKRKRIVFQFLVNRSLRSDHLSEGAWANCLTVKKKVGIIHTNQWPSPKIKQQNIYDMGN